MQKNNRVSRSANNESEQPNGIWKIVRALLLVGFVAILAFEAFLLWQVCQLR